MTAFYCGGLLLAIFLWRKQKCSMLCAAVLVAGSLAAACVHGYSIWGNSHTALTEIARADKSGIEQNLILEAQAGDEKADISLTIAPQRYSREELAEMSGRMWDELEKRIAGKNASLDYVTEDLYFPQRVEGYPFFLQWYAEYGKPVHSDGRLDGEIPPQGAISEIRVQIRADGSDYEEEQRFSVHVFPSQETDAFWRRLEDRMKEVEQESREEGTYRLPGQFEDRELMFYTKREDCSGVLFILSIAGAAAVVLGEKREKEKRERERVSKMMSEYPEMVYRMAMLTGAGMSISGALRKIAGEYAVGKKEKRESEKILFAELVVTCREMEAGVPEAAAYQNMSIRCGLPCVAKFTTLLHRYTRSGAAGLKQALYEETEAALRERKECAKRMGEEAGTKLLLPMTMMLIVVMAMIMMPAFTSFGV